MFNETDESIDLEKDFPQIEDIKGFMEMKPSVGSSTKDISHYTKQNLPSGFIHCKNPLCKHGGVPLGEVFRVKLLEMIKKREEEDTISEHCRGYENMGRGLKRDCLGTSITVSINIKYKL
jgi:hypothetical protein